MHYLVIERFKDAPAIYQRLAKGRMMPEGLNYVSSWIDQPPSKPAAGDGDRRLRSARALDRQLERFEWNSNIPVRTSTEVAELMKREGR